MSRELSPSLQAGVKEDVVYPFFAVDMIFDSGPLYFWTGPEDRTIEGKPYIASNSMLSVSSVEETADMEVRGAQVSLSGIPSSILSVALSEPLRNRRCGIDLGALNTYENRLQYSEQFHRPPWATLDATIGADAALNPDGDATSADLVTEGITNAAHAVEQFDTTLNNTDTYGFRCRVKANGRTKIRLQVNALGGDQARAEFDLATGLTDGTAALGTGVVNSSAITDLGGGWFLLEMICKPSTTVGTNVGFSVMLGNGTSFSYLGDGVSGAYVWGAHLIVGTTFGAYARTLDKVITTTTTLFTEVFSGTMSEMNISEGGEHSTVTVKAINKAADWERPRIRRLTSAYQKSKYPTDTGLDFIEDIQNKPVFFGKPGN